jgi:hypothetical protein
MLPHQKELVFRLRATAAGDGPVHISSSWSLYMLDLWDQFVIAVNFGT